LLLADVEGDELAHLAGAIAGRVFHLRTLFRSQPIVARLAQSGAWWPANASSNGEMRRQD